MDYLDLINQGVPESEIKKHLTDGDMTAITIRIPKNLKVAAAKAASLEGMSFSAYVRSCLIDKLTKEYK